MRALAVALILALGPLAGCTGDGPEESTTTDAPIQESTEPTPASPTAPTNDGIVDVSSRVIEPTPSPPPPAPAAPQSAPPAPEPAPPQPAPAPAAPPPGPSSSASPTPAPSPTASPTPSPTPTPSATPSPSPTPAPEPEPSSWPREGSTVSYRVSTVEDDPGPMSRQWFFNASWSFTNGDWRGTCLGERYERFEEEPPTRAPIERAFVPSDPPHWPLFNTRDPGPTESTVTSWLMKYDCGIMSRDAEFQGVFQDDVDNFHATDFDTGEPDRYLTTWSRETGLVQMWNWSQRNTHTHGELTGFG